MTTNLLKLLLVWVVLNVSTVVSDGKDAVVYLPLSFHTESKHIFTTAFMEVVETSFEPDKWWEKSSTSTNEIVTSFKRLISAISKEDRDGMREASAPSEARDQNRSEDQYSALSQQLKTIKIESVPRAYSFEDFVVYFAILDYQGKQIATPFVFKYYSSDGALKFLPLRTESLSYVLVYEWFKKQDLRTYVEKPKYIDPSFLNLATHCLTLAAKTNDIKRRFQPVQIWLKGEPTSNRRDESRLAAKLNAKIQEIDSSLTNAGIDEFAMHLTSEGASRIKAWYSSAEESDRYDFKKSVAMHRPFFIFDCSPLIVVYTRTDGSGRGVEVLYFVRDSSDRLVWTNLSHVTAIDKLFKMGQLYQEASSSEPFKRIEKK